MRHLFFLVAMPLVIDAFVAMCLGAGGHGATAPAQIGTLPGYVVVFDWDGVELSPGGRRTLAAVARAARAQGITSIEILGALNQAAGPAYAQALAMERARRVRSELLHDGLAATDISVAGPGTIPTAPRRVHLVLQWTS
jgi:outer membrane protein OmpA-like peptidoglycan-associated protein